MPPRMGAAMLARLVLRVLLRNCPADRPLLMCCLRSGRIVFLLGEKKRGLHFVGPLFMCFAGVGFKALRPCEGLFRR